jgi:hypothetical protein
MPTCAVVIAAHSVVGQARLWAGRLGPSGGSMGATAVAAMPLPADAALADWLRERTGQRLCRRAPVGGGSIHAAWRLELEGG